MIHQKCGTHQINKIETWNEINVFFSKETSTLLWGKIYIQLQWTMTLGNDMTKTTYHEDLAIWQH